VRVGLIQEGDLAGDVSCEQRYHEMIEEVVRAEAAGFSCWGTSEQHFSPPRFSVASPEVLYGAVAQATSRITIRNMAAILLTYNHPVLVAERTATVDILSNGRAELATARSNNLFTIEALGVPTHSTREQWSESLEIIGHAFATGSFEHEGEFWTIPKRPLIPRPVQDPHPALYLIATGPDTPRVAAERGLGMICWDNYLGWDYLASQVQLYKEHIGAANPVGAFVKDYVSYFVATAYCAETREEAIEEVMELTTAYVDQGVTLYRRMPDKPEFAYMRETADMLEAHRTDIAYLAAHSPSVMAGTPDDFIEQLRKLEDLGVEEVVLRVDGFGHEANLRVIDLIGETVIPAVDPEWAKAPVPSP
jgi:alkanesulfonate monooxygenase SsuD/methylene tetrahydromethanopterin reductase-like flavin-dependent oxidoreductase (luciferase family)